MNIRGRIPTNGEREEREKTLGTAKKGHSCNKMGRKKPSGDYAEGYGNQPCSLRASGENSGLVRGGADVDYGTKTIGAKSQQNGTDQAHSKLSKSSEGALAKFLPNIYTRNTGRCAMCLRGTRKIRTIW